MNQPFAVSSFVIRFIHTPPGEEERLYRGSIQHVQSNREIKFSSWDEAQSFMQSFVPLNQKPKNQEPRKDET